MKATRRRDGQNRFTLKIPHHPGRHELMSILLFDAAIYSRNFKTDYKMPATRQEILDLAVRTYTAHGKEFHTAATIDEETEIYGKYLTAASNAVDQLFPELMDRKLSDSPMM